jgi:Ca-activated chloride channel homolog
MPAISLRLSCVCIFVALLPGASTPVIGPDGQKVRGYRTPKAAPTIRVDVNLALVPVTVIDPAGRNVLGLTSSNFRVLDDSQSRPIVSFSLQDAPISLGLVFDCSRSMTSKFRVSRQAPVQLFSQLNPEDEAFLVTVADRAVVCAEQRVDREGSSPSGARMRSAVSKSGGNSSLAGKSGRYGEA